jgi:hypothetical protein
VQTHCGYRSFFAVENQNDGGPSFDVSKHGNRPLFETTQISPRITIGPPRKSDVSGEWFSLAVSPLVASLFQTQPILFLDLRKVLKFGGPRREHGALEGAVVGVRCGSQMTERLWECTAEKFM